MQHRRLAGRMYAAYPEIFRRHPRIEAYSTVVPRCIMSMAAFCEGLKETDPSLEIFTETSNVNMYYLNPHSTGNPAGTAEDFRYKSADAPWRPEWRRFCEERIDVETILARLFTDTAYARSICDPLKFEQDLFSVAAHMQCTDLDESFYDLFTFDELCPFLGVRQLYLLCRERARSAQPRARHGAGRDVARRHRVARRRGYGRRRTVGTPAFRPRRLHHGAADAHADRRLDDARYRSGEDQGRMAGSPDPHGVEHAVRLLPQQEESRRRSRAGLAQRKGTTSSAFRRPGLPTTGGRISGISMPESYGKPDLNSKPRNETDSQNAAFRSRTDGRLPAGGDRPGPLPPDAARPYSRVSSTATERLWRASACRTACSSRRPTPPAATASNPTSRRASSSPSRRRTGSLPRPTASSRFSGRRSTRWMPVTNSTTSILQASISRATR